MGAVPVTDSKGPSPLDVYESSQYVHRSKLFIVTILRCGKL